MSNTIEMRSYPSHEAVLLQQRPSDIIEAAEVMAVAPALNPRKVHVIYDIGQPQVLNTSVIGARDAIATPDMVLTSGAQVYLLSMSRQTTSPDSPANAQDFVAQDSWIRWADETRKLLQKTATSVQRSSMAAAPLRVDRLVGLQAAFGFTIQELAEILGISRQQLYKWLDVATEVKLNETSRTRLASIERIAKQWTLRSTMSLSSVSREPVVDSCTVFEMLSADVVDEAAVAIAFDELVIKLQSKPKTRSQRLRDAGFTRRVSALPSDE